jgi:thiol-disulfide isomerase/thioredoxin
MPLGMEAVLRLSMEDKDGQGLYGQKIMSKTASRLICCVVALCTWLGPVALSAKHAPDPAFKALDGGTRKLSSLRGQVVVVNFWATWCGPCQEELPRLSQLAAAYAGKPVRFALISIDAPKDRAKIPAVLERLHVSLESWEDADTDTMDHFGLGDIVPGTAILDEKGEVVARIMGEAREEDVRGAVDWMLGRRTGPAPAALTKRY